MKNIKIIAIAGLSLLATTFAFAEGNAIKKLNLSHEQAKKMNMQTKDHQHDNSMPNKGHEGMSGSHKMSPDQMKKKDHMEHNGKMETKSGGQPKMQKHMKSGEKMDHSGKGGMM
ncbi:MAG: hypothetical protein DKM50_09675 [Candidatus Margulisiibacteriota bacterium]|nr:MAG: hypothetical protein DKM50_09675 [Candidatus Margulisiibacteriota bacterium]HCY36942.1 hypothetical protein [Candidatus Margulisiibacteriota bacterium]